MSPHGRDRRSRLAQLAHGAGMRRGTRAIRERARGKPNCKCAKGKKHVSLHLMAGYRRCCPGCLRRTIHTTGGDRIQYYHRNVTAPLTTEGRPFLVDAEPQKPGEDELAAAIRLLDRVAQNYPRAFYVVAERSRSADPDLTGSVSLPVRYSAHPGQAA